MRAGGAFTGGTPLSSTLTLSLPKKSRFLDAASAAKRLPIGGLLALAIVFAVAVLGPLIEPHDPLQVDYTKRLLPPVWQQNGSVDYFFGTDALGRDLLSRVIQGSRFSLAVGFAAVGIAGTLGATVGLLSGYFGRWADTVLMRLTDTMLAMPLFMVAVLLAGILGPSLVNVIIVLGVMRWPSYARVVRGEVLRLREADFIKLAVIGGCSPQKILVKHMLPNVMDPLIVLATLELGVAIIMESSLSFLGLGVPPPNPAWGLMVADGRNYLGVAWWVATIPGLAITSTVLGFNWVGDWLRVRLDPRFNYL